MNLKSLQTELAKIQKRGRALESQIKARAAKQYTALPGKVGLKTIDMLIHALLPYSSPRMKGNLGGGKKADTSAAEKTTKLGRPPGSGKRSKSSTRNRYSAAVKAAIRRELEKGGKTYTQLSKEFGPSAFSIKDWKKAWGLTKPRKKK
jgi:hypothetical protein